MPKPSDYPAPTRALADGDVVLSSVDGKTTSTPVETIAAYVAEKNGSGGGGSSGGSTSGQFAA